MITPEIAAFVHRQRLGFHATVCADGTPNLSPKGTTAVYDPEHLMFAELRSPQTLANLEANPSIEVNMVDPIVRKGWRFKGKAAVRRDSEVRERARSRSTSGRATRSTRSGSARSSSSGSSRSGS